MTLSKRIRLNSSRRSVSRTEMASCSIFWIVSDGTSGCPSKDTFSCPMSLLKRLISNIGLDLSP